MWTNISVLNGPSMKLNYWINDYFNLVHVFSYLNTLKQKACFTGCGQTLPDAPQPIDKIHPVTKISVTFQPMMHFWFPLSFRIPLTCVNSLFYDWKHHLKTIGLVGFAQVCLILYIYFKHQCFFSLLNIEGLVGTLYSRIRPMYCQLLMTFIILTWKCCQN